MAGEMVRFNTTKPPLSLVPPSLTRYAAFAFWYGSLKYERNNWRKAGPWTSVIDSLQRHLDAIKEGDDFDTESGLPHLCLAAANLSFLIEFFDKDLGTDDRFKYADGPSVRDLSFNEPPRQQLP